MVDLSGLRGDRPPQILPTTSHCHCRALENRNLERQRGTLQSRALQHSPTSGVQQPVPIYKKDLKKPNPKLYFLWTERHSNNHQRWWHHEEGVVPVLWLLSLRVLLRCAVCTSVPAAQALSWPHNSTGLCTNRAPTARGGLAVPGCAPLTLSKGTQCFRVTLTWPVLPCQRRTAGQVSGDGGMPLGSTLHPQGISTQDKETCPT